MLRASSVMLFSVVIPTWNRKDDLSEALASVLCQQGVELEIIVIDNGSHDGTREYCLGLAAQDARVRYFRFEENRGITIAENKGFVEARGEIIFCIDDDELVEGNDLLRQVENLAAERSWDLLNIGMFNTYSGEWEHYVFSQSRKNNLLRSFYVNNFVNGTVFIKKEVIEKIGLFEKRYFRQAQENEYALRAILNGFNILYYPQLKLRHKVNPFRPTSHEVSYYMLRNTLLKNYKYFSGMRLFVLQTWQLTQFALRLVAGRISPRLMIRALRDYAAMKKTVARMLDYDPAAMERYFFVARKVATTPEQIGKLGFFQYCVMGMTRFF